MVPMDDTGPHRQDRGHGKDGGPQGAPGQEMPRDVARRLKTRSQAGTRALAQLAASETMGGFLRQTYALPRDEARERARDWFARYPKAAYMTKVESWRQLPDGRIEFTMRRLPTAD
jgi:hypothetical protein